MDLLARQLQNLLDKNNIKPAALAKAIDVNKSTISRILSGSAIPSVETIFKVATFFDVKMEYFMTDESCLIATHDVDEANMIDAYRQLSLLDKQEIFELIQFKLSRTGYVKGEPKEMEKSTISMNSEECATIEKMA